MTVRRRRAAVYPSRASAAGVVIASVLLDPLGAGVDGAVRVGDRRPGMESRGVLEKPRPAFKPGDGAVVLCADQESGGGTHVGRSLHCRWNADRTLGQSQEIPA